MTNTAQTATTHLPGAVELPASLHDATSLDLDALGPIECPSCYGSGLSDRARAYAEDPTAPSLEDRHVAACRLHDEELFCPECGGSGRVPLRCEGCDAEIASGAHCSTCADAPELMPANWLSAPCGVLMASMAAARRYPELTRMIGAALARGVARGPVTVVTTSGETVREVA